MEGSCGPRATLRRAGDSDQGVTEFWRSSCRLLAGESRLVFAFSPLVMETNLVRANRARQAQPRGLRAHGVKPRRLVGSVPVGGLPNFANPTTISAPGPSETMRRRQTIGRPRATLRWMLKDTAPCPNGVQGGLEATTIVTGAIVLATPAHVIDASHCPPELTRWVGHNWMGSGVKTSIAALVPGVNASQVEVAAASFDVERSDLAHPRTLGHDRTRPVMVTATITTVRRTPFISHNLRH